MIRILSLVIILFLSTAGFLLLQSAPEVFLLDTAAQFQNLVKCSDTQMAQSCWKTFGDAILLLAKPSLSGIAYQIAEVCLKQAESQHLHDLQFLLNVQKCFHLADRIDLRPVCETAQLNKNKRWVFETWILTLQTLILVYLVLNISDGTFGRMWDAITFGCDFFKHSFRLFLSAFQYNLKIYFSKYLWCQSQTEEEVLLSAVFRNGGFSGKTLGAKWTRDEKAAPNSQVRRERENDYKQPDTSIHKNHNENRTKRRKKLPYKSACEVSDYETHNACGQDSDDYTDFSDQISGKCESVCGNSLRVIDIEKRISTIIPIQREASGRQVSILCDNRILSKEMKFGPHEITTTDDVRPLNLIPKNYSKVKAPQEIFVGLTDENEFPILSVKPSFDISTEAGRAKMKAFVRAKMGYKIPRTSSRNESNAYLQHSKSDSENLKMRRVFVANKGWIWLSNLESNGVKFVTGTGSALGS